jgi:hypothetical protein
MPIVAIADDFLDAYARIPRSEQKRVREFTEKFKKDPASASINYEKIHDVKDLKVRTVRISQKYRAIILHPDEGDVYVLVWVDNHDEAMAWAASRVFDVNPYSGSLQVVNVVEAEKASPPKPGKKAKGLSIQKNRSTQTIWRRRWSIRIRAAVLSQSTARKTWLRCSTPRWRSGASFCTQVRNGWSQKTSMAPRECWAARAQGRP